LFVLSDAIAVFKSRRLTGLEDFELGVGE